jgi:hypothetical protein
MREEEDRLGKGPMTLRQRGFIPDPDLFSLIKLSDGVRLSDLPLEQPND